MKYQFEIRFEKSETHFLSSYWQKYFKFCLPQETVAFGNNIKKE